MNTATFHFGKFAAALAVAVTIASGPALADSRPTHAARAARAQVTHSVTTKEGVPLDRAQALRECNDLALTIKDYAWGTFQNQVYRSCMTQHGQPE